MSTNKKADGSEKAKPGPKPDKPKKKRAKNGSSIKSQPIKKKQCLEQLRLSLGIVSKACQEIGITTNTFYVWKKSDPEFAQAVEDLNEFIIDYVESQLYRQIGEGNTTATIFYLKTKAKHRGYVEQYNYTIKPLEINYIVPTDAQHLITENNPIINEVEE